jgi:nuclear pore complex protein Nup107
LAALVRFYVHLILILRSLGQPVPDTDANIIIQAYLDILKETGNQNLVAMYAACLREGSGEVSYARFLRGKLALYRAIQTDVPVGLLLP